MHPATSDEAEKQTAVSCLAGAVVHDREVVLANNVQRLRNVNLNINIDQNHNRNEPLTRSHPIFPLLHVNRERERESLQPKKKKVHCPLAAYHVADAARAASLLGDEAVANHVLGNVACTLGAVLNILFFCLFLGVLWSFVGIVLFV